MKRIWTFLFLLGCTAVFLIACNSNQAAEAETPVQMQNTADRNSTTTIDFSLIGETGRPQFLNAYASW